MVMNKLVALAAALSVFAAVPALSDYGSARSRYQRSGSYLAETESSGPTRSGHDTAMAETESNGPTRSGHDTAMA